MHYNADIVCITETWLTTSSMLELNKLDGYTLFSNVRNVKSGGGTAIYVQDNMRCRELLSNVTSYDAFNICAVVVGQQPNEVLVVTVYRPNWASASDLKDLCRQLDQVTYKYAKIVLVGDFNFHNDAFDSAISTSCSEFHRFIMERDLYILDSGPTRGKSKVDLVFALSHFTDSHIVVLPSIAGADHDIQLVSIPQWSDWSHIREWAQIDYLQLDNTLEQIDWSSFFLAVSLLTNMQNDLQIGS